MKRWSAKMLQNSYEVVVNFGRQHTVHQLSPYKLVAICQDAQVCCLYLVVI